MGAELSRVVVSPHYEPEALASAPRRSGARGRVRVDVRGSGGSSRRPAEHDAPEQRHCRSRAPSALALVQRDGRDLTRFRPVAQLLGRAGHDRGPAPRSEEQRRPGVVAGSPAEPVPRALASDLGGRPSRPGRVLFHRRCRTECRLDAVRGGHRRRPEQHHRRPALRRDPVPRVHRPGAAHRRRGVPRVDRAGHRARRRARVCSCGSDGA